MRIIDESFCFHNSTIKKSSLNKVDIILNILNIDDGSKIIRLGHGTNSCAYRVENKVIKVGLSKLNRLIFEHPNIIRVYFKDNIELLHNDNIIRVGIEIQDLATPNDSNDVNKLYNIYKNLRDAGILWTDIKLDNVGQYNNKLVVIDTDDCYFINGNEKIWYNNDIAEKFSLLYNKTGGSIKNE